MQKPMPRIYGGPMGEDPGGSDGERGVSGGESYELDRMARLVNEFDAERKTFEFILQESARTDRDKELARRVAHPVRGSEDDTAENDAVRNGVLQLARLSDAFQQLADTDDLLHRLSAMEDRLVVLAGRMAEPDGPVSVLKLTGLSMDVPYNTMAQMRGYDEGAAKEAYGMGENLVILRAVLREVAAMVDKAEMLAKEWRRKVLAMQTGSINYATTADSDLFGKMPEWIEHRSARRLERKRRPSRRRQPRE